MCSGLNSANLIQPGIGNGEDMNLVECFVCLLVGFAFALFVIFILQKEWLYTGSKRLHVLYESIRSYTQTKQELQGQIKILKSQIGELERSTMQLRDERRLIELAWQKSLGTLQSTSRVSVDEAMIFGRGEEWVYLYTFPAHEHLAQARQQKHFPMKLGMSTQSNVVDRVHQQVSGNSTAISERAIIRLVFRVNSSRALESWMHEFLKRNGRQLVGSVGVEWFNTNPIEIEQLFRSYVLQRLDAQTAD